ncbi:MAG: MoaD/ThiS family protein [Chromatiales bacterium]|nr:MoaD/ThiS family protein [Chromatiales bacterium]
MNGSADKVTVHLPLALREFVGGQVTITVAGDTLRQVLFELAREYPLAGARILGPEGDLRRHVNVFIGEVNVRDRQGLDSLIEKGDEIYVIPAVAGG